MLIACPECAHEVSDRAAACPKCGFPIAEHVAEQRAAQVAEHERTTRRPTGAETDCASCLGRGFVMHCWTDEHGNEAQGFEWCERCDETGHVPVVESSLGFWSVAIADVEAFVRGELGPGAPSVRGPHPEAPPPPTYGKGKARSRT